MKSAEPRVLAAVALVLCASCAPAPLPDRGLVAPLAIGPATPPRPAPTPGPEAPPRAPDDLELLVRVSDPEQLARVISSFVPSGLAASVDPAQLVVTLLGRKLGSLVDLARPIDVTSNTGSSFVVSMAVKQDAEANLGQGLVLREEGGLLRIGKLADSPSESDRFACAFSGASGPATTRLLCATDEAALTGSAPYLTRNVASEPLDTDLRLTLPGHALREKKGATTKAMGDAASARLAEGLVERFLAEVDRLDVNVRFGAAAIELGLDLRLTTRTSMVAQVLVTRTAPAPPSPMFYRLPGDALFALHTTGALAEDIAPLRRALADNIEETLVQDGYRADKTHEFREKIESLLLTGGPLVVGIGVAGGRDGAEKALAAFDSSTPAEQPRAEAKARTSLVPWFMVAVEEPAEKWTTGMREVVRRGQEAEKTRRPGGKSTTPHDPDGDHFDLRIGALDPSLKLPKSSLHVEVLIASRTKGKRPSRIAHLFIVPRGSGTWIGYSEDVSAISSRLRLAVDDAVETGTLSRSEEAKSLRSRPALGAGLFSLSGLGLLTAKTATGDDLRRASRNALRTANVSAHGSTSLTWTGTADPTPGALRFSLGAELTPQLTTEVLRMLGM